MSSNDDVSYEPQNCFSFRVVQFLSTLRERLLKLRRAIHSHEPKSGAIKSRVLQLLLNILICNDKKAEASLQMLRPKRL